MLPGGLTFQKGYKGTELLQVRFIFWKSETFWLGSPYNLCHNEWRTHEVQIP